MPCTVLSICWIQSTDIWKGSPKSLDGMVTLLSDDDDDDEDQDGENDDVRDGIELTAKVCSEMINVVNAVQGSCLSTVQGY